MGGKQVGLRVRMEKLKWRTGKSVIHLGVSLLGVATGLPGRVLATDAKRWELES